MAGLRSIIKLLGNLTIGEAGNENIATDLINRKDRFEQAAGIIRSDLNIRSPQKIKT